MSKLLECKRMDAIHKPNLAKNAAMFQVSPTVR